MATAFETGLDTAETAVTGFATSAMPVVIGVSVAFLAVKYARRIINRL